MYTPQQPEYYLRRDFEEQYSLAGTPFLDVRSSPADSRNLIIHGHNMKDGSMFAPLRFYLEKKSMAWSTHPLNCPLRTVCGDMH